MMKKILAMLLALVLVICATVAGTLAYLTSEDEVVNTFTVGKVIISLDETDVDNDDNTSDVTEVDGVKRDKANSYSLMPGKKHTKDPVVEVKQGSEDCYVRVLVTINNKADLDSIFARHGSIADMQEIFGGWNDAVWTYHAMTTEGDSNTYELRYHEKVMEPKRLPAVFETLNIPGWFTDADIKSLLDDPETTAVEEPLQITVRAEAIQADGFEEDTVTGETAADAAFKALEQQKNSTTAP